MQPTNTSEFGQGREQTIATYPVPKQKDRLAAVSPVFWRG